MGADLQGHKEEGSQPPPYHTVRVTFDPYSHSEVQKFLSVCRKEFPKLVDSERWTWSPVPSSNPIADKNIWVLEFLFRDIEDAMMFSLKYSR